MRAVNLFVIACISILSASALAQTETDFDRKYTKIVSFEVRPNIQMRAEFGSDGQVVSVTLMSNRVSVKEKTTFVGNQSLDVDEVEKIFEEIVPAQFRAAEVESPGSGGTRGMAWRRFTQGAVRVNLITSLRSRSPDSSPDPWEENAADETLQKRSRSLFCVSGKSPETVTITWVNRVPKPGDSPSEKQ